MARKRTTAHAPDMALNKTPYVVYVCKASKRIIVRSPVLVASTIGSSARDSDLLRNTYSAPPPLQGIRKCCDSVTNSKYYQPIEVNPLVLT